MTTKTMKQSTKVNEIRHLANVLANSVDGIKKTGDALEFELGIIAKMMAFLVSETEDDLQIARLWIGFEMELKRLANIENQATQLVLQPTFQVLDSGSKQARNNPKKS